MNFAKDNIHLLLYIMKIQNKVYEIALIVFHPLLDHLKNAKSPTHPYSGENRLRIVGKLLVFSNNVTTFTSFLASL